MRYSLYHSICTPYVQFYERTLICLKPHSKILTRYNSSQHRGLCGDVNAELFQSLDQHLEASLPRLDSLLLRCGPTCGILETKFPARKTLQKIMAL